MGGPSQSSINQENSIASQQLQVSQQAEATSQQEQAQMTALEQPAINFNQGIASGNKATAFNSIAPLVSSISAGGEAAKGQIMEQLPAGAGQQVALANNAQSTYSQIAAAGNSAYTGSFDKLANIGSGLGSFGLSELGAGLSGLQGASTTTSNVANQQAQGKASTLGFIGQLAGAAGSAASGTSFAAAGCWIAEAIYGTDNWRTHLVREWLNGPFRATAHGRMVMAFYLRFGRSIAKRVKKSAALRRTLKPLFDAALNRAIGADECRTLNL